MTLCFDTFQQQGKRFTMQTSVGRSFLKKRTTKDLPFCEEALRSVARLAEAVRGDKKGLNNFLRQMLQEDEPLLEQMFSDGLSRPLVESLEDISSSVPDLLAPIQLRLMSELALVLTGRRDTWDQFIFESMAADGTRDHHGVIPTTSSRKEQKKDLEATSSSGGLLDQFKNVFGKLLSTNPSEDHHQSGQGMDTVSVPQLQLALETLGTFDLSNLRRHLLPFVASPRGGKNHCSVSLLFFFMFFCFCFFVFLFFFVWRPAR